MKKDLPNRNEYIIPLKKGRKGGPMRNKKDKRKTRKSKIKKIIKEQLD